MPRTTEPVVAAGSMASRDQSTLSVDELELRPWTTVDVDALVEAYRDPAIRYGRWRQ